MPSPPSRQTARRRGCRQLACALLAAAALRGASAQPELFVTTLAGAGVASGGGFVDGVGSAAKFLAPYTLTLDGAGRAYIADTKNGVIRVLTLATAAVATLAGGGSAGGTARGYADGAGTAAVFQLPTGVALVGGASLLVVADHQNNLLRAVSTATGVVTTLVGGGRAGGTAQGRSDGFGSAAMFRHPQGIASDGEMVYVADADNNLIRAVNTASLLVSTLAGGGKPKKTTAGRADGVGLAALFAEPYDVCVGRTQARAQLFVADYSNNVIRILDIGTRNVTTLAGGGSALGTVAGFADGVGSAALFTLPTGVAVAGDTIFVAGYSSNVIRTISAATRVVSTIAGGGGGGGTLAGWADGAALSVALFHNPSDVDVDAQGRVYVVDRTNNMIRILAPAAPAPPPAGGVSSGVALSIAAAVLAPVIAGAAYIVRARHSAAAASQQPFQKLDAGSREDDDGSGEISMIGIDRASMQNASTGLEAQSCAIEDVQQPASASAASGARL